MAHPSAPLLFFVVHALLFLDAVWIQSTLAATREIRVLNIGWLSNNGTALADEASFTASLWIPIAVKHFNERSNDVLPLSTLVNPRCTSRLTLVGGVHDDEQSPHQAMRIFVSEAKDADILLGPVLSHTTVPVAVASAAFGMPQMSFGASADELSNKIDFPTFFRMGSTNAQSAEALALLFQEFKFKKIGLISVDNQFGLAIKSALQRECSKLGIRVFVQEYENVLGEELEQQAFAGLQTLKTLRLNVIVYAATRFEFIHALAKAGNKLAWTKGKLYLSHVYLTDYGTLTFDEVLYAYKFLNGSLHVQATHDPGNQGFRNMIQLWSTLNASDLNPSLPSKFHVGSDFFKRGQEQSAGRGWAWAYDSVITIGLATCGASDSILSNLPSVDFFGTSGRVNFNPRTQDRDPRAFYYVLTNLIVNEDVTDGKQPVVGVLGEDGVWNISGTIRFSDGLSKPPSDTDPPANQVERIPVGAKVYGWIGATIALLTSLLTLGYVLRHKNERIIAESQPFYLAMLCIGGSLMAASIIALAIETDAACMAFPWMFTSGIVLAMASLTVKSARIAIFWRHRGEISPLKKKLGTKILPALMWLIVFIDLSILLAWQIIAPWRLVMVTLDEDESGNPLRSSIVCTSNAKASDVFCGILIGYMILIAIITGWVSFRVRNAPRRYHEAKMTAFAGISIFQVLLVAVPVAYAVWLLALPRFLVLSTTCFLLCMIILTTMFAPKIFKERFLGPMAAKSASLKRKEVADKSVTFDASSVTLVQETQTEDPESVPPVASKQSSTSLLRPNVKPVPDWKLMILGIRSEGESDSESPPDHDYAQDTMLFSPRDEHIVQTAGNDFPPTLPESSEAQSEPSISARTDAASAPSEQSRVLQLI